MNELWERLRIGAEQIGTVLPALAGAAVILLTGYFLARQIQRRRAASLIELQRITGAPAAKHQRRVPLDHHRQG